MVAHACRDTWRTLTADRVGTAGARPAWDARGRPARHPAALPVAGAGYAQPQSVYPAQGEA